MGVHLQVRTETECLIQTAGRMKATGRRQLVRLDQDSVEEVGMWLLRIVGCLTELMLGWQMRLVGLIMEGEG